MLFAGFCAFNPQEGDHRHVAALYQRIFSDISQPGNTLRIMGWDGGTPGANFIQFIGVEISDLDALADDMMAWELDQGIWTIWEKRPGHAAVRTWETPLTWDWLHSLELCPEHEVGEFTANLPACWRGDTTTGPCTFSLFAHSYIPARSKGPKDEIYLVDYTPAWPEAFADMAQWLRQQLGSAMATRIEHYGSTAIPGMPAKPVIDVLVEIPSFRQAREFIIPRLLCPGWEYWCYDNHMVLFKRESITGERTHHIHLAPKDHRLWEGLVFRDYLRTHPQDAERYATLKQNLAQAHRQDREVYTGSKTGFIKEILEKAR